MRYIIDSTKRFDKELDKVKDKERIFKYLERQRENPFCNLKKLVDHEFNCYEIGSYRIFVKIKQDKLIILALSINKRGKCYDKKYLNELDKMK